MRFSPFRFSLSRLHQFIVLALLSLLVGGLFPASLHAQTASQRRAENRRRRIAQLVEETYGHKYEVGVTGSLARVRPGDSLRHVTEGAWSVEGTDEFGPRLGLTANVKGYYGQLSINPNEFALYNRHISQYLFMGGPTYRLYAERRYAAAVRILAGAGYGNFGGDLGTIPPQLVGLYPEGMAFAGSAGLVLDYNIDPQLAVRLIPEITATTFGSSSQFNRGFSIGIIYRFGQR